MDQIGKYWGLWGASRSSSSSTVSPAWAAAAYGGSSESSWEEQAFARDAAAHLGGCVWPPRYYSCTFCQREFRSAQALGGHMNVHRRDRALLRQGGSPSPEDVHAADTTEQGGLLYRAVAAAACNPSSTATPTTTAAAGITTTAGARSAAAMGDGDATTTTPTSYLSTIIKECKTNKLFRPMPDHSVVDTREDQAAIDGHQGDHNDDGDGMQSARKKRRRLDHHPLAAAALMIFVQPTAKAATEVTDAGRESQGGADHETKVPQTTILPQSSPLLDQRQELDLELRLGTSNPKVYIYGHTQS